MDHVADLSAGQHTRLPPITPIRVAIVGSHGTGKSTLVTELVHRIPGLVAIEEPYYHLLSAGHAFSEPPMIADFEELVDAAIATFATHPARSLVFDRSPADYLAYLVALQSQRPLGDHVAATLSALNTLDLVVYVPIERPDRLPDADLPRLRRRVDRVLREMFIDQTWGWTIPCLEVHGTMHQRADQVVAHMAAHGIFRAGV